MKKTILALFLSIMIVVGCVPLGTITMKADAESTVTVGSDFTVDGKISDNTTTLPEGYGESVVANQQPSYIHYIEEYTSSGELTIRRQTKKYDEDINLTDGKTNADWRYGSAKFAKVVDGAIQKYTDLYPGSYYMSITFTLKQITDITGFSIVHHGTPALRVSQYEIYASDYYGTLYFPENKIATIDNTNADQRQVLSGITGAEDSLYFGIKIINPVNESATTGANYLTSASNWYPRIYELCVYGEEKGTSPIMAGISNGTATKTTVSATCDYEQIDWTSEEQLQKNKLLGKTSEIVYSSVALSDKGYCDSGSSTSTANFTDGSVSTDWASSTFPFNYEDSSGNAAYYRNNEHHYMDIFFDAGASIDVGMMYIRNHNNQDLRPAHYQIWASNSSSDYTEWQKTYERSGYFWNYTYTQTHSLGSATLLADCYNYTSQADNYFFPTDDLTGTYRYFLIRVLDVCHDYSSKTLVDTPTYAYPRFVEFAVYDKDEIKGNLEFGSHTVDSDGYMGPYNYGKTVASLMADFSGRGDFTVATNSGSAKGASEPLLGGDTVLADTGYGSESAQVLVYYDANCDGKFTVSDAVFYRSYALGINTDPVVLKTGDIDGGGAVTVTEVVASFEAAADGNPDPVEVTASLPVYGGAFGSPTEDTRKITVDTKNVLNDNFIGLGTNSFTSVLTAEGMQKTGLNKVYHELNKERLTSLSLNASRIYFQIDWMIPDSGDAEADKTNYLNGVYDLSSEKMKAFYEYSKMLKDMDTDIEVTFGWKNAERIQEWFNAPVDAGYEQVAAPADLDAFASAAIAFLKHTREQKDLTNIKYISFYNEPNIGDFEITSVDEKIYWSRMLNTFNTKLVSAGMDDEVEVWGPEISGIEVVDDIHYGWWTGVLDLSTENAVSSVDTWSFHHYYDFDPSMNNYKRAVETFRRCKDALSTRGIENNSCIITEMYGFSSDPSFRSWFTWNDSITGYLTAIANSGFSGMFTWTTTSSYIPEPLNMQPSSLRDPWAHPHSETACSEVRRSFYEQSLIGNYVPKGSKVLYTDWIGDDIRASAYSFEQDGGTGYTVVVEKNGYFSGAVLDNGKNNPMDVNISLSNRVNATFNRFSYIAETQVVDSQATVNPLDKTIKCKNGVIKDSYNENYGVYVYTTLEPIKQVEINKNVLHLAKGESFDFDATLIDCDTTDEIEFSITECTGTEPGTINSETGVYTASSSATKGDMVAVRATLKSDPKVFAVAIIYID